MAAARDHLVLEPIGDDPEVGVWLAAMEDCRRDTIRAVEHVTEPMIDWYPAVQLNSIGSLLYHIALVEASWVAEDILEAREPDELASLLPWSDRELGGGDGNQRHLTRIDGQSLGSHLERLARIRAFTLERLTPMTNRSHIAWLRDTFPGS